jgi:hypothetical protein
MAKVTVQIDPNTQEVTIEVNGVKGGKCTDITAALLQNNEVVDQQYTEEYHTPEELPDYITDQTEGE